VCISHSNCVRTLRGFSDRVRAQAEWVLSMPAALDLKSAGPLLCGGITVFNPILEFGVNPTIVWE